MTERILLRKITQCEDCPYYTTSKHRKTNKYYTNCNLSHKTIVSNEEPQPIDLFKLCKLPTQEETLSKLLKKLDNLHLKIKKLFSQYADKLTTASLEYFIIWLKTQDSTYIYHNSSEKLIKEFKRWKKDKID